ncbi:NADP-dependent oxidoreductase [Subtercola endophyticus]|uniref:NADP-dependent oxidoreductase n=1 Tax=Subtercola endophyticus TaxID=2895559 RepID=UPI001E46C644|nr:NADP-dependent oxidoreductase [Subtercola endophyticus]UFS59137.1 NADP-dependent oxidoreductase [Subtercola endophyticus]
MPRRVQYSRFGGPEVLEVAEIDVPRASEGQVVVEVRAAGVNPIDWKLRGGLRASGPLTEPRGVGTDAAGVIVEVHESVARDGGARDGVDGWQVGDEVIVRGVYGAYASHLAADAAHLVAKPAGLDWGQAAAVGVPVGTAYQALRSLGVGEGTTLLIHGASGGVGQAAVQFAREWGATVIGTASPANHARLIELGAIPVAYGPGLVERVRAAAPGGIDLVLDAVGTDEAIAASLELVDDRAAIGTVVVGARAAELGIRAWAGGNPVPLTPEEQALRAESLSVLAELLAAGRFEIEVSQALPLEQAAEAHRISEAGHVRGKLVLIP